MRRATLLCLLVCALAPATAAAGQDARPALRLAVERTGADRTVLTGTRVRVRGVVDGYAAGQRFAVRAFRGDRRLSEQEVTLQPLPDGRGRFVLDLRLDDVGPIAIRAAHAGTAQMPTVRGAAPAVLVLPRAVGPRSGSRSVRALQGALRSRGYVVGAPGRLDGRTARAVLAFRKVTGMRRTSTASADVLRRLAAGGGVFRVRFPSHGRHVETDLSRQVMVFAVGRRVERIYHVSTGAPATPTVRGSFRVYRKDPGTNAKGMIHSSYFIRGYAMHGFRSVPIYPASHGCVRVPPPDALSIFRWMRMGTRVDVYR